MATKTTAKIEPWPDNAVAAAIKAYDEALWRRDQGEGYEAYQQRRMRQALVVADLVRQGVGK